MKSILEASVVQWIDKSLALACKPGVAGSIQGFSKNNSLPVEPSGAPGETKTKKKQPPIVLVSPRNKKKLKSIFLYPILVKLGCEGVGYFLIFDPKHRFWGGPHGRAVKSVVS